jgi:hypothetical protein
VQAGEVGVADAARPTAGGAVDRFVERAQRAVGGAESQVVVVGAEPVALRGGDVARMQVGLKRGDLAPYSPIGLTNAFGWSGWRSPPTPAFLVRSIAMFASCWTEWRPPVTWSIVMSGWAATVRIDRATGPEESPPPQPASSSASATTTVTGRAGAGAFIGTRRGLTVAKLGSARRGGVTGSLPNSRVTGSSQLGNKMST